MELGRREQPFVRGRLRKDCRAAGTFCGLKGKLNGRMCAGVPAEEVGMWLGHDIGHSG